MRAASALSYFGHLALTIFQGKWGCKFFLDQRYKAIQVIDKDTEDEDYILDEIAGGQPVIKSLSVCDASA